MYDFKTVILIWAISFTCLIVCNRFKFRGKKAVQIICVIIFLIMAALFMRLLLISILKFAVAVTTIQFLEV